MRREYTLTRRGFLTAAASASVMLAACSASGGNQNGQAVASYEPFDKMTDGDGTFSYNAADNGVELHHCDILCPSFFIYAGNKDHDGAADLVGQLNMADTVDTWRGTITVVNPIDGQSYSDADADHFIELVDAAGPVNDVKVIGIDDGTDFVLGPLASKLYCVAGIMTYGGSGNADASGAPFVPAYLSGASDAARSTLVSANGATETSDGIYENSDDPLKRVVVANDPDLATAFSNAWDQVFSQNYRQHNEKTEFYMTTAAAQTDPYPLYSIPSFDESVATYVEHYNESVDGLDGEYTWFEYVPTQVANADEGSVPLVVTLHGNLNDTRCQIDASGWPELAVQEGFIVAAPEWQDVVYESMSTDPEPNFFNCDGLQNDRIVTWVQLIEKTYPQIDTSRIYVTGLSAGASASELYGVKYSNVFAAVGAVSGPGIDKQELTTLSQSWDGPEVPLVYFCGDHDFFGMIPVDLSSPNAYKVDDAGTTIAKVDPNVYIFPVIQAFQRINGLTVSEAPDLSLNEWYGIQFDETNDIKLGEKDAQEGVLYDANGTAIVKLLAIKDQAHWNWKPEAAYLWEFFKNFSR